MRLAKDHGVIMLCLPPPTTHESQPLDCGVFGPLKSQWCNVCHTFFQKNPGRVITKFQFSAAWARAISPANIIAGFRTCGIYPFNPTAIKVPEAKSNLDNTASITARPSSLLNETKCNEARQFAFPLNPTDSSHSTPSSSGTTHLLTPSAVTSGGASVVAVSTSLVQGANHVSVTAEGNGFTDEELELFERRYEEGYNIYIDHNYVRWLELHHPESLPADRYSLSSTTEVSGFMSVADQYLSIAPEVPLVNVDRNCISADGADQQPSKCDEAIITCERQSETVTSEQSVSPIYKYLVLPTSSAPTGPKTLPRARLLTSAECLAQLEAKERQKQLAAEEKEQRKREREEKKAKKEQEQKQKAEARPQKAEERTRKNGRDRFCHCCLDLHKIFLFCIHLFVHCFHGLRTLFVVYT